MNNLEIEGGNGTIESPYVFTGENEFIGSYVKLDNESTGKRLVKNVREYIEKFYADNIKIADIAKENFISEGYLTHTFKAETGMSPREYLSHIRCTRAYELIRHTEMKFSAISAVTGFCCANDMSRKIREYYGYTPTEIRAGR
mgnify:CR=1 FL=1